MWRFFSSALLVTLYLTFGPKKHKLFEIVLSYTVILDNHWQLEGSHGIWSVRPSIFLLIYLSVFLELDCFFLNFGMVLQTHI